MLMAIHERIWWMPRRPRGVTTPGPTSNPRSHRDASSMKRNSVWSASSILLREMVNCPCRDATFQLPATGRSFNNSRPDRVLWPRPDKLKHLEREVAGQDIELEIRVKSTIPFQISSLGIRGILGRFLVGIRARFLEHGDLWTWTNFRRIDVCKIFEV